MTLIEKIKGLREHYFLLGQVAYLDANEVIDVIRQHEQTDAREWTFHKNPDGVEYWYAISLKDPRQPDPRTEQNMEGVNSVCQSSGMKPEPLGVPVSTKGDNLAPSTTPQKQVSGDVCEIWTNTKDEWSDAIEAAHPINTGDHATYYKAQDMVSNRHSKYELVDLVNWLLQTQPREE